MYGACTRAYLCVDVRHRSWADVRCPPCAAPWCGHCQALEPEFEAAALLAGGDDPATLAKIDVTANQASARKYGVTQLPTVKLFRDGEMADEYSGQRTSGAIVDYLRQQGGGGGGGGGGAAQAATDGAMGEPQIVTRDGEERVYIPFNKPAQGGGSDDKAAPPTKDKAQAKPNRAAAAAAGRGTKGRKKPAYSSMPKVGLDQLEPGRGFSASRRPSAHRPARRLTHSHLARAALEEWVFEPAKCKNNPLVEAGALQLDFAVTDKATGKRAKVVLGSEDAPELDRILKMMPSRDMGENGLRRLDLVVRPVLTATASVSQHCV